MTPNHSGLARRGARIAVLATALLMLAAAGCGPVKVQSAATTAHVAAPRTVTFHVDETVKPSLVPSAGRGQQVWERSINGQSCAGCHGPQGKPSVAGAPDFSNPAWVRDKSPLALEQFLREGPGHQYADTLTMQERWDVLAYCRFVGVSLDEVRATATLRFGKNCNVCHGNKGFGNGFLSPTMQPPPRNLDDYATWGVMRTDQEIFNNIWYGVHFSAMPPWRGTLSKEDVWHIVDFIRYLQYEPAQG